MGLPDPHRPIKNQILSAGDKIQRFKPLPTECRGKLHGFIAIAFEGLVYRKSGPLDQAPPAVFVPQIQFRLQQLFHEFQMFLGTLFHTDLRYPCREEQLPAPRKDACAQCFLHFRCHHDALPPFFRNISSYTARGGQDCGGVSIPYPVILAASTAASQMLTLPLAAAISMCL